MPIKVLLYDDNADRRESLTLLLQSYPEFEVCGSFPDCTNVIEEVRILTPDVVLMDIQMPHADGLYGVKTIKQQFPQAKVIMQTVFDDDDKVFEALLNGASGYILKRTSSEKIIEAIRDVQEGGSPMTPSIAAKVLQHFRQQQPTSPPDYQLTDKEKIILNLLVDGLSYKMIADRCDVSYHTVNSHIKKIYEKLHVHSVSEAVSKALHEKLVTK
jgi:DNA-binding NarL/FixJ family response regulator